MASPEGSVTRLGWATLTTSLCLLSPACGPAVSLEDGSSEDSTSGEASDSTGLPPGGTSADTTDVGSEDTIDPDEGGEVDSGGPGCTFTCPDPPPPPPGSTSGGSPALECSLLDQDCPEGEKCMPWANDGGNVWNATRCAPTDNEPGQYGEACLVEGSGVSGIDTCALGLMCFGVDPRTNEGECAALCSGSEGDPFETLLCDDPDLSCILINDVLPLCATECDPVAPACPGNQACYLNGDGFTCADVPDSAAAEGEPCVGVSGCSEGLMCAYGPAFECGAEPGEGCCAATCDTTSVDPCPGNECLPWFPEPAPAGYEHIGVCGSST